MMNQLLTFGGLSLVDDNGSCVASNAPRRRLALLALLAVAGQRGLSRDKVLAFLWPESDAEHARHSLNQTLYTLRRDLGCDALIQTGLELRLNTERLCSDVADFQSALSAGDLRAAVRYYRGPFADGFFLSESADFERWLESERGRLASLFTRALESLAREGERQGDHAAAADWWRRLAAFDPLNAPVARGLITSLAASGDKAGALRHARVFQRLLQDELGVELDTATHRVVESLKSEGSHVPLPRVSHARGDEPPSTASLGIKPARSTPEVEAPVASEAGTVVRGTPRSLAVSKEWFSLARGRRTRRRRWFIAATAALLVGIMAMSYRALRGASDDLDSHRVLVAALKNETGDARFDPLGMMVADWIIQGLSSSELVDVVDDGTTLTAWQAATSGTTPRVRLSTEELARETRAGLIVTGSYRQWGENLEFQAAVVDAKRGQPLRVIKPVRLPQHATAEALSLVRQRVIAALAPLVNPALGTWARSNSTPPSYEAYLEYVRGVDEFLSDVDGAILHFRRASQMDTTFAVPLIWLLQGYMTVNDVLRADSVADMASKRQNELPQYDRYLLDELRANLRGRHEAAYESSLLALQAMPGSPDALRNAGYAAVDANHPRKALELLSQLDPRLGWCRDCEHYWWDLTSAEHMLGEYDQELADARRGIAQFPAMMPMHADEIRALAASGRIKAVEQALDSCSHLHAAAWFDQMYVIGNAAAELRAHGHPAEAQRVLQRGLGWYDALPISEKQSGLHDMNYALLLYGAQRWRDAAIMFRRVLARDPRSSFYAGFVAAAELRAGRPEMADSLIAVFLSPTPWYNYGLHAAWLARLYAIKGDRERAVAALRRSFEEGREFNVLLHTDPDLEPLKGYQPFEELMRPKG